jgi:ABC-type microcin C transport system duplicated ATPase subunit YejF
MVELHVGAFDRYPGEFSGGRGSASGSRARWLWSRNSWLPMVLSALDASVQAQVLQLC